MQKYWATYGLFSLPLSAVISQFSPQPIHCCMLMSLDVIRLCLMYNSLSVVALSGKENSAIFAPSAD